MNGGQAAALLNFYLYDSGLAPVTTPIFFGGIAFVYAGFGGSGGRGGLDKILGCF